MNIIKRNWHQKSYIFLVFLLILFVVQGCRIIAEYDKATENAIFASAKEVDRFYGHLLETDENEREYSKYSDMYVEIEAQLNALVLRNKVRELNKDSTEIAENILKLWRESKVSHKEKNTYTTGTAKLDRGRFERVFSYALRAEGAKKPDK